MTDTEKPTPGEWQNFALSINGVKDENYREINAGMGYLCDETNQGFNLKGFIRPVDAELIAEAGTVYHETNLTPRQLLERVRELEGQIQSIIEKSHSHIDGRFLFEPLLNRKTLDIKKRKDGVDTWYEGDWLSDLGKTIQKAKAALAKHGEQK